MASIVPLLTWVDFLLQEFLDDRGKFKTPTLRNIELTAPYMHDGRFATLEEVLDHYNEHVNINRTDIDLLMQDTNNDTSSSFLALTKNEKKAIIAFLKTLTDEKFINNKSFSDPNIIDNN